MEKSQNSGLKTTVHGVAMRLAAAAGMVIACTASADPLNSAFTYRGELSAGGVPAVGAHDLRFRMYDTLAGGVQVGPTLCVDNSILVDGRFTAELDFGMVFDGAKYFLEVEVRPDTGLGCGDASGMTTLSPRQAMLVTPNAAYSINATNATNAATADSAMTAASAATATTADTATTAANALLFNGQPAAFYQNAANLTGSVPATALAGAYSGTLNFSNEANAYAGSGAALTALNASNVSSGTLSDLRLSSNVALRNAANAFGNFTNTFLGDVGIGAAVPNAKLDVAGSIVLRDTGNNPAIRLSPSTGGFGVDPEFFIQDTASGGGGLNTNFHLSRNASFRGSDSTYNRVDITEEASSIQFSNTGDISFSFAPSGANPVVWQSNLLIAGSTGDVTVGTGNLLVSSGKVGIGTTAPAYPLNFANTLGDKISLFGTAADHYGFGIQTNQLQIHTNNSGSDILFGHGNSAAMTETMRIQGDGRVGIGTQTPDNTMLHALTDTRLSAGTFESSLAGGVGVWGIANGTTLDSVAGAFITYSNAGTGVHAIAEANTGVTYGVRAYTDSSAANAVGVFGQALRSGANFGVYGQAAGASSFGVYANGRLGASGTKSFMIDHPLDPENKVLYHYSMESPEVLNVYSGTTQLDESGEAWILLPDYFSSINIDPRYMLTAVGGPAPMLHIAAEVEGNRFKVAGGTPNGKVSWEIKARRNDRFVEVYGAPVERLKGDGEKGTYLRPELFGQPESKGQMNTTPRTRPSQPARADAVVVSSK